MPLLIGGATTSRIHTAVKIAPQYSRPGRPRDGCVARGRCRRRARPAGPARRVRRPASATSTRRSGASGRARRAKEKRLTDRRGARQPTCRSTGLPSPRRARRSSGADVRRLPARRARRAHRLDAVLHDLGAARRLPGDPRRPAARAGGARPPPRRAGAARPDRRRAGGCGATRSSGFWPANTRRRRHRRSGATRTGRNRAPSSGRCASRWPSPTAGRTSPWRTSWLPPRPGVADYVGAFAVTTGHRPRRARRGVRGRQRRLLGDPRQGARRPAGRGLRRAAPRARPARAVGLRAGRGADQRRT